MAEKGNAITLMDYSRILDPNDKIARIIEIMNKKNEILDDILWKEGNLPNGHQTTVRTGIPLPTWRKLNYGVLPTKSTSATITDTCGMLEAYTEIDKRLADRNNNSSDFFLSESKAQIEGFGRTIADAFFYGDITISPEKITGFDPRFNALSTNEDMSGYNIIDAGGTGSNNTSIWAIAWSEDTVHGIYPKGSKAGLKYERLPEATKTLSDGSMYQVLRANYQWDCGLTVRNWKAVCRVANIDWTALLTAGDTTDTSANITKYMTMALDRIEEFVPGANVAFYMRPEVKSMLAIKINKQAQSTLTRETIMGRQNVLAFLGYPIRVNRALLKTESRIV